MKAIRCTRCGKYQTIPANHLDMSHEVNATVKIFGNQENMNDEIFSYLPDITNSGCIVVDLCSNCVKEFVSSFMHDSDE